MIGSATAVNTSLAVSELQGQVGVALILFR